MKVVHICMVAYLDGWGYQDNLLPAYTAKAGHDVVVITPIDHFPTFLKEEEKKKILAKGADYYDGAVHVYRIHTKYNTSNLTFYCKGITDILNNEKPDAIYHHGVNCSSMIICSRYIRNHPEVKFFIDNHADNINESKNKLVNIVINNGLLRICTKTVNSKVTKYYGVTPGRCSYLSGVYGADTKKIELLPIGFDTVAIESVKSSKEELRQQCQFPQDSFIIVSGGKMGVDKGTKSLIDAFLKLKEGHPTLMLVLFGRFTDKGTEDYANNMPNVYTMGWCDRDRTLSLLKLSDVACWPIHHTTLIEDAVGSAIPIVVRNTPNTSHLIDGNGEYVVNGSTEELVKSLSKVINNYNQYKEKAISMSTKYTYPNLVKHIEKDCRNI